MLLAARYFLVIIADQLRCPPCSVIHTYLISWGDVCIVSVALVVWLHVGVAVGPAAVATYQHVLSTPGVCFEWLSL